MKSSKVVALLLACAVAAMAAGGVSAMSTAKQPKFNAHYDCSKAVPLKVLNSFLGHWEGKLALKGKSVNNAYLDGGGSGCTYKHADGPFAGQWAAGIVIAYGAKNASRLYKSDERTAKHVGAQACASNTTPPADPRACGPVEISGVGTKAYEAFFYIATLKGKVFVQLEVGQSIVNGQYAGSTTMPPADMLGNAAKAILARLR